MLINIHKQALWIFKCAAENGNSSTLVKLTGILIVSCYFRWAEMKSSKLPPLVSSSPQSGSRLLTVHLLLHGRSVSLLYTLPAPGGSIWKQGSKDNSHGDRQLLNKARSVSRSIRFFLLEPMQRCGNGDQPQRCQGPAASRRDILPLFNHTQ